MSDFENRFFKRNSIRMEVGLIVEDMQRRLQVPGLPASATANRAEVLSWKDRLMDVWRNLEEE